MVPMPTKPPPKLAGPALAAVRVLLGRCTYDIFAAYWPRVPADSDSRAIADLFNSVPKHLATHRSGTLDWQNSHALEGDLATRYAA